MSSWTEGLEVSEDFNDATVYAKLPLVNVAKNNKAGIALARTAQEKDRFKMSFRKFHLRFFVVVLALVASLCPDLVGQTSPSAGSVHGVVFDQSTGRPLEYIALTLKTAQGQPAGRAAVTDRKGAFAFDGVPFAAYKVAYSPVGAEGRESPLFTLDAQHPSCDLGRLPLDESTVKLEKLEVTSRREMLSNSIDRKIYTVGKDLQSTSGSASQLLQGIPSVQVDIEGNVSLRGNDNVLILINGKSSPLMSATNRADVLEQMPADSIDKIEVITNPSAKYKPDGTAGIINLTLKRRHNAGLSGVARISVGNDSRYNAALTANCNPGRYNLFGTASVRQDDRLRYNRETRSHLDTATNTFLTTNQKTVEHMRPLSRLAQLGAEFNASETDKLSATADYNLRTFFRNSTVSNLSQSATGAVLSDYDRLRTDPEWQKTVSFASTYQHTFPEEGHELNLEFKRDRHWEHEDNHYTDVYRTPVTPTTFDNTLMLPVETGEELIAEYVRPMDHDSKLEAGYSREANGSDTDFRGSFLDPVSNTWLVDTAKTNRFIYHDVIHALYTTYARTFGRFGMLGGLRMEQTYIDTNQVTAHITGQNNYFRLYPSLHLSYNLTDTGQLQLNYSHRIHHPESDDLNPFPEYQDPYNLRAGNPYLRPEDTDSFESGYQFKQDNTTLLAALYYRYTYHAFTDFTRYIDSTTLLTTKENLTANRSGGLELAATADLWSRVTLNFSANAFRSEIDASNLGFSTARSATAWSAKLNANWRATPRDTVQFNTNYTAKRLTAQGYRLPTFVANIGLRHELTDRRTAFVLTVSDVFNSLEEKTVIDTPILHDFITRRRSSRIIYLGITYNLGQPTKKKKDDALQFDNQL